MQRIVPSPSDPRQNRPPGLSAALAVAYRGRMGRYQRDPERRRVSDLIDKEVQRAADAKVDGEWITYLIRDPRKPDKLGNIAGTPIYVGQTKDFRTRVRSRFDRCEKAATAKDTIEKRLADLLHAGVVASYEVLERTPTRLASLVSETNWARRCVARGYDIANRLEEQRRAGPPISRSQIPRSWVWPFLLSEAIEDGIGLTLNCAACGLQLPLSLNRFVQMDEPPRSLFQIRTDPMWQSMPCTQCNEIGQRRIAIIY